jgi:hypothetical protein
LHFTEGQVFIDVEVGVQHYLVRSGRLREVFSWVGGVPVDIVLGGWIVPGKAVVFSLLVRIAVEDSVVGSESHEDPNALLRNAIIGLAIGLALAVVVASAAVSEVELDPGLFNSNVVLVAEGFERVELPD